MNKKLFVLPELPYAYKDLEPYISEELLVVHHQKHHQAYVNVANNLLEKINLSRTEGEDLDIKALLKELSFNIGGHRLHTLYWENLAPEGDGQNLPTGKIAALVNQEFGSLERFKKEFNQTALSVEGSGWAALVMNRELNKPLLMQIEKHNTNLYPEDKILLVVDVFEHAYYLDYKNDRARYLEGFWQIINWPKVNERLEK